MKSSVLAALLLALTTPLLSSEIPETNCREFFQNEEGLSLIEITELDLMQGIWVKKDDQNQTEMTFKFQKSGSVDIISKSLKSAAIFSHAHWSVEEHDGKAVLVWEEHNEKDKLLGIDQTCDGIILTDFGTEKSYELTFVPAEKSSKIDFMRKSMFGNWSNASYPFDISEEETDCGTFQLIEGAFLEYYFKNDGTYTKKWGSSKLEFTEKGKWEISADGKYLVFRAQSEDKSHESERTYLAKIKMLDMDKVVLAQALQSPGFDDLFCTKHKDFLFVR